MVQVGCVVHSHSLSAWRGGGEDGRVGRGGEENALAVIFPAENGGRREACTLTNGLTGKTEMKMEVGRAVGFIVVREEGRRRRGARKIDVKGMNIDIKFCIEWSKKT